MQLLANSLFKYFMSVVVLIVFSQAGTLTDHLCSTSLWKGWLKNTINSYHFTHEQNRRIAGILGPSNFRLGSAFHTQPVQPSCCMPVSVTLGESSGRVGLQVLPLPVGTSCCGMLWYQAECKHICCLCF